MREKLKVELKDIKKRGDKLKVEINTLSSSLKNVIDKLEDTKLEIKDPVNGLSIPFATIPDCSGNTTNANRIKKHLDKNCH